MNLSLFIVGITSSINILLLLIIIKNSKETSKKAVSVFGASVIFLLAWSLCNYLADSATLVTTALTYTRLAFPSALLMGGGILLFSYIFPGGSISRSVHGVYVFLIGSFSLASFSDSIITQVTLGESGVTDVTTGNLYPGILIMYIAIISHSTYNFILRYKKSHGKEKQQLKYILIGWTTFLSIAVITNAILPYILGNAVWSKFGPLGSVAMVACTTYAIIRHQFLDIKIIIQRGLVYSVLFSFIVILYISTLFTVEHLLPIDHDRTLLLVSIITTAFGIFTVPYLNRLLEKVTDPIFFKGRYNYADTVALLTKTLNDTISLTSIVKKTTSILKEKLKVSEVIFDLSQDKEKKYNEMLSFSITSNRKHIGTLYLGDKKSGDPYSKTDILLLETFTKQAGIALEKANLYDKIKEHASTLEQKVSERTKELEVLQREKELLMLEISHGLQTPLTIIKGELFFLKKEGADESRLVTVDSSIDRISHFIYRLLSLAHVEKQEKKELALLPLNEVIEDTLSLFEANIEENAINLHMSLEENVVIEGNKNDLDELISNLISNAIKYIGSTVNKTITLTLTKKGKQAILTIQDTGIGMDEDELKHLFEKFYRVKNSETKGIKGTGLGLAIAKKIIENHRGTVQVMSAKGIGTTFTITFPLAKE